MRAAVGQLTERRIAGQRHHGALHDAIGQQFTGDSHNLALIEVALDQVGPGGGHGEMVGQVQFGGGSNHVARRQVRLPVGGVDVNFPKHHGSSLG